MHVRNTSAAVMKQITMSTSVETNREAVKFMLTFVAVTMMAINFVPSTHAGLVLPS